MTTILPTDDLRPDLFVTVHSHLDRTQETARRRMAMAQEAGEEGRGQLSIGKMRADQWPSQWDLGTMEELHTPFETPKSH